MRKFNNRPHRFPHPYDLADDASDAVIDNTAVPAVSAGSDVISTVLDDKLKTFKRAMVEDAIKIAAIQIGVSVTLMVLDAEIMCFAPIGTVIGAVLAVIQYFGGQYAKREIKEVIANTVAQIKQHAVAAQQPIRDFARTVADQEYPAAQTLAASGQALGDSGFWVKPGKAITVAARQIVAPVAKPAATAITNAVHTAGDLFLKQAILGAHLVGDKKGEERARKAEALWNSKAAYFQQQSIQLAGDPIALVREMHSYPTKYLMGTSGVDVAIKKCRDLLASADAAIAKMSAEAMTSIASPDYRLALRIALARGIRQDPSELAKAQQVHQIEQQASATVTQAETAAATGVATVTPPVSTGGLLGTLALIGGFFWMNK